VIEAKPAGRLRLVLQRASEDIHEPDEPTDPPMVRLTAYAGHRRMFGWLQLDADRLTDVLNACAELHLRDAQVEDLATGRSQPEEEILIARRDLVAVTVGRPRGDPALRRPTRTHPVAMQSGDYLVGGYLHVVPGVDPLANFRARPTMVPLTYAWIEHWSRDARSAQAIGTVVVNRDRVDWVRVVTDEELIGGQLRPSWSKPSG
jgi:hypothetical protein